MKKERNRHPASILALLVPRLHIVLVAGLNVVFITRLVLPLYPPLRIVVVLIAGAAIIRRARPQPLDRRYQPLDARRLHANGALQGLDLPRNRPELLPLLARSRQLGRQHRPL